jgi:hypothetical protein
MTPKPLPDVLWLSLTVDSGFFNVFLCPELLEGDPFQTVTFTIAGYVHCLAVTAALFRGVEWRKTVFVTVLVHLCHSYHWSTLRA